jgi:PAS domain S-box-containing protein
MSDKQYKALIENTPDIIMRFDRDYRHLYVSPSVKNIVDLDPEDFIGKSHRELGFPENICEICERGIGAVFESAEVFETAFVYEGKSGEVIFNWRVFPEFNQKGLVKTVMSVARDITECKRAEEVLRNEKAFTEIALNSQLDTFFLFEPTTGKAVRWNRAFNDTTGYTDEEIAGMVAPDSYYSPEDLERTGIFIQEVLETGIGTIELELICKDGSKVPTEYKVSVIKDEVGKPKYFISIGRDITERKRAEEALRESEATIRSVFGVVPVGICIMKDRVYQSANKNWCESFGYPEESLLGKTTRMLYENDEEYQRVGQELYKQLLESGLTSVETRLRRSDGVFRDVVLIAAPLQSDDLEAGIVVVIHDVTERKRAEESLKESEEKFRMLSDFSPIGVFQTDADGRVLYLNDHWSLISGMQRKEALGFGWISALHPEDKPRVLADWKKCLKEKTGWDGEFRFVRLSGEIRTVHTKTMPIRSTAGDIIGHVGANADITERKQLEEERVRAAKLESIGLLAGGIAHDFNNILSVILGSVSLANMMVQEECQVKESLEAAEKACRRAGDLTQQLLTFSKGGEPVKKTTALLGLIEEASGFTLRGSNVKIKHYISKDLWPCDIDEGQICQVIHNLLINADQAMPEGGTISISATNVTVGRNDRLPLNKGRYIKLTIKDKGYGIPKEDLSKLFDPYFTTKEKGSGLGLATTYSTIKRHGGYITVESELNAGTTFHIYLPASCKQVQEKEGERNDNTHTRGKILVMDDEQDLRDVISRMLEKMGHEVEFAENGTQSIKMYREAKDKSQPFDAVILDLTIPGGMGGRETMQRLLKIDPDVKAIVSSGYSNDPVLADFKEYGFNSKVSKPYRIEKIREVLQSVLKEKNGRSSKKA